MNVREGFLKWLVQSCKQSCVKVFVWNFLASELMIAMKGLFYKIGLSQKAGYCDIELNLSTCLLNGAFFPLVC